MPSATLPVGRAEGDRPRRRHVGGPSGVPVVEGVEVVLGEHGVLVIDEPRVLEERRVLDRPPVLLGRAQIGEREDGVVVARRRERLEPAVHLADHGVDAVGAPGGAVVLTGGLVLGREPGGERRPPHERRILGSRRSHQK
jgi:hypothetical protein